MQIHDVIINIAVLIVSTYLYSFNFKFFKENRLKQKIGTGFLFGLISVLSMIFSFELSSGLIFDGRSIILGLSGIFGGIYASLISIFISLLYRVFLGGHGMLTGILVIIITGLSGALVHFYKYKYSKNIKLYHIYIFGLIIHIITIFLFLTIPGKEAFQAIKNVWKVFILLYPIVLVIIYYIFKDQEKRINEAYALRASEEAVRDNEIKFRAVFENSIDAIGVSKRGVHIFINQAYVKLFGYNNSDELIDKPILDLIAPNERIKILDYIKKREDEPKNFNIYETKGLRNDGAIFDMEVHVSIYRLNNENYTLVILRDITKRKQAEYELIKSKEKAEESEKENKEKANFIKKIIDSSAISTWISDEKGTAIMTNPACLKFFGATETEIIGKYNIFQDSEVTNQGFMPLIHDTFKKGKIANFVIDYNFAEVNHVDVKNATHKIINTIVTPIIDLNGRVSNVIFQSVDLTESKRIETELIKAKERAEESDRLKSAFLTNMSHEIRTPLNAVLGFSELLTQTNINESEKEIFSEYIRLNGQSLAKIIDDIIDISKLESKRLSITKASFNLHTLFNELNNYYSSLLVQKAKSHIELVMDLPKELKTDFYIESDEQRLKQVLNNLISNAIKYSEKGQITFGYKINKNSIHFYVKDTGFGIGPENISKIFERFIQFSPQYVSKHEGTGLGLAICKNLVDLLGGELMVESKVNIGSNFFFEIPLINSEKPSRIYDKKTINLKKDLSKYKILIADDEDSNYVLSKRILKPTKVVADWAQNGKQAVEMATNNKYDLIITIVR
ncbi:MAG: PAS domain S-box protein [Salinivirgaceae bacterium]|nr:PAS domain S-box protein [Salinivirgaceae bacterium]